MKRELTIKGSTIDEKFKSTELILRRMGRRMIDKVVGIMPVSFVFNSIYKPTSEGLIHKTIFPASGFLSKGYISLDSSGPVVLTLKIVNSKLKKSFLQDYIVKKGDTSIDLKLNIISGDKVSIFAFPSKETKEKDKGGEYIKEILFGALYEIDYKNLDGKTFLIDEIDKLT